MKRISGNSFVKPCPTLFLLAFAYKHRRRRRILLPLLLSDKCYSSSSSFSSSPLDFPQNGRRKWGNIWSSPLTLFCGGIAPFLLLLPGEKMVFFLLFWGGGSSGSLLVDPLANVLCDTIPPPPLQKRGGRKPFSLLLLPRRGEAHNQGMRGGATTLLRRGNGSEATLSTSVTLSPP